MIIGIDLGTTNSLAAIWRDGAAELVPQVHGGVLTPSVVSLDDDGTVLTGHVARERLATAPDRTVAAFKRSMGTGRSFRLGDREFRPEELSSFLLRALKADAEALLGDTVREAVITVPAYFNDAQRKATRIAGELAGLTVERLINEPTAAALAYGLHDRTATGRILVFDLGGGTFDVSVLDLFDGVVEVRATAGDNFLGGEDFDDALLSWFGSTTGWRPDTATPSGIADAARLRRAAEAARRALDREDRVVLALPGRPDGPSAELTTETFARLAQPLLERMRRPVERALRDSRIRPADLSQVVLAGGASRMRPVRLLAASLFGRLPLQTLNPDEIVARGAAVQAGLKARDRALAETVLTDVTPYTLGIEIVERGPHGNTPGRLLPIIERNTVVPVSRVERVSPTADFQRSVRVRVFQGESRLVKDDILLGTIDLTLEPRPVASQAIDVRFTYDVNGLLEVTAESLGSGAVERIVIEEHPGVLRPDEIAARFAALSALKIHPRDAAPNRLLLAEAERLYEESLGDARTALARAIAAFEHTLRTQDDLTIQQGAEQLRGTMSAIADR